MHAERTIHIDAPAERVWDVTVDVERWPGWTPTTLKVERLDTAPLAVGSKAKLTLKGVRPAVWTITRLDAPRAFVWEMTAIPGARVIATHLIVESGSGCDVTLAIDAVGPLSWVMAPFVKRMTARNLVLESEGLKAFCETGATVATP